MAIVAPPSSVRPASRARPPDPDKNIALSQGDNVKLFRTTAARHESAGISFRLRLAMGFGFILALVCVIAAMAWVQLTTTSRRIDAFQRAQSEASGLLTRMVGEI